MDCQMKSLPQVRLELFRFFQLGPVDVAPVPMLAGFERRDRRRIRLVKMSCGAMTRRILTTADLPSTQAEAKMIPVCAHFQALFASTSSVTSGLNFLLLHLILRHVDED